MVKKKHRSIARFAELIVLAMLGALLFLGKMLLEAFPNIEIVSTLVMVYTLVYRSRALIPIYVYAFLFGVVYGFPMAFWPFHLYVWTILWGITMLLPRMAEPVLGVIYMVVCGLFGLAFGVLTAPFPAFAFGYTWEQLPAYIALGLPFDLLHAAGNAALGTLIYPLSQVLLRLRYKMWNGRLPGQRRSDEKANVNISQKP